MAENTGALSVFTNEKGGIEDDLIVSKTNASYFYMVTNAGCKEKDLHRLNSHAARWREAGKEVEIESLEGRGLVAVQGMGVFMHHVSHRRVEVPLQALKWPSYYKRT